MRRALLFVILSLFLPTLLWAWPGQVIRVSDGDTIVVLTEDKEQVRIIMLPV